MAKVCRYLRGLAAIMAMLPYYLRAFKASRRHRHAIPPSWFYLFSEIVSETLGG